MDFSGDDDAGSSDGGGDVGLATKSKFHFCFTIPEFCIIHFPLYTLLFTLPLLKARYVKDMVQDLDICLFNSTIVIVSIHSYL